MIASMSDATCGAACWAAREDICRCQCGGVNHGCLRDGNGEQPARTSRIRGWMYQLVATGRPSVIDAKRNRIRHLIEDAQDSRFSNAYYTRLGGRYSLMHETEAGTPAISRKASESQIARWSEFAAAREPQLGYRRPTYGLWVRTDALAYAAEVE